MTHAVMSLERKLLNIPLSSLLCKIIVLLVTTMSLLIAPATSTIDPNTTLDCHIRLYSQQVVKPPIYNTDGTLVHCSGSVFVYSCWGRCDSSETQDGDLAGCSDFLNFLGSVGEVRTSSSWVCCIARSSVSIYSTNVIGDYQMPYRISNHPVCTYTGRISRIVSLSNCEGYTDPTVVVFDASGCECRVCNSDYTSCENSSG